MKALQTLLYLHTHMGTDDGERDALPPGSEQEAKPQLRGLGTAPGPQRCRRHSARDQENVLHQPSCSIAAPNSKGDCWPPSVRIDGSSFE